MCTAYASKGNAVCSPPPTEFALSSASSSASANFCGAIARTAFCKDLARACANCFALSSSSENSSKAAFCSSLSSAYTFLMAWSSSISPPDKSDALKCIVGRASCENSSSGSAALTSNSPSSSETSSPSMVATCSCGTPAQPVSAGPWRRCCNSPFDTTGTACCKTASLVRPPSANNSFARSSLTVTPV